MNAQLLNIRFLKDDLGGLLLVDAAGVHHANVKPMKLFPLTEVDRWISIHSSSGKELLCIEDPKALPADSYALLMASLAETHFVPIIHAIHAIKRLASGHEWHVTTNYGSMSFDVETDENIHTLSNGRLVIIDRSNTRYLIPDVALLDPASKHRLGHY